MTRTSRVLGSSRRRAVAILLGGALLVALLPASVAGAPVVELEVGEPVVHAVEDLGATATLDGGAEPGTLTLRLFGPETAGCDGVAIYTESMPVSGAGRMRSSDLARAGLTDTAGTWSWQALRESESGVRATSQCLAQRLVIVPTIVGPTRPASVDPDERLSARYAVQADDPACLDGATVEATADLEDGTSEKLGITQQRTSPVRIEAELDARLPPGVHALHIDLVSPHPHCADRDTGPGVGLDALVSVGDPDARAEGVGQYDLDDDGSLRASYAFHLPADGTTGRVLWQVAGRWRLRGEIRPGDPVRVIECPAGVGMRSPDSSAACLWFSGHGRLERYSPGTDDYPAAWVPETAPSWEVVAYDGGEVIVCRDRCTTTQPDDWLALRSRDGPMVLRGSLVRPLRSGHVEVR